MAPRTIHIRDRTGRLSAWSWRVRETAVSTTIAWQSVDIVLERAHPASPSAAVVHQPLDELKVHLGGDGRSVNAQDFGSESAFHFFLQCLFPHNSDNHHNDDDDDDGPLVRVAKLIIPLQQGYIVRSDIIPLRLRDCQLVEMAVSFAEPLQRYAGGRLQHNDDLRLPALFAAAAAGLILRRDSDTILRGGGIERLSRAVDSELENRLSLAWILPENDAPDHRRTLVLVEGGRAHPSNGGGTGPAIYSAAKALGIDLVVLDNSGHWLEEAEFRHWYKAFVPTRLTDPPEPDFAERIVKAVERYHGRPVDGITTFCDSYMVPVAQAAEQLGLPTASPDALRTATDKYLTSVFADHQGYKVSSPDHALDIARTNKLAYPLILKPCNGWSSEEVFRIDSLDMLAAAVESLKSSSGRRHGSEFVLEKYCAGPEVDANFVLLDGEILFFEVCDDFPKSADLNGPSVGSLNTFIELNSVYPSALPRDEIDGLRSDFVDILLRLGLKNGIMHLEGRVEDSSVEYKTQDGVLDLYARDRTTGPTTKSSSWLIEINPRPLGMTGGQIIESTYGIDYWGLAMLIAVGDKARARALARPFKHGAQYSCVMVFIPADYSLTCRGIFDSDDICAELKARRPDLARHISRCGCLVKRGQRVPHPSSGVNSFLAYFNVFSRKSRQEALKMAEQVREEVRFSFI